MILALAFRENPLPLNELIGYVKSKVLRERLPEQSLIDNEQKGVGECFYYFA